MTACTRILHRSRPGEQRDSESGYDYLRARYYDPAIGRFLSRDPAGQGNFFSYVGNNPVNLTDPSGRFLICHLPPWAQSYDELVCYDSTEIGLLADEPEFCNPGLSICVWPDGSVYGFSKENRTSAYIGEARVSIREPTVVRPGDLSMTAIREVGE